MKVSSFQLLNLKGGDMPFDHLEEVPAFRIGTTIYENSEKERRQEMEEKKVIQVGDRVIMLNDYSLASTYKKGQVLTVQEIGPSSLTFIEGTTSLTHEEGLSDYVAHEEDLYKVGEEVVLLNANNTMCKKREVHKITEVNIHRGTERRVFRLSNSLRGKILKWFHLEHIMHRRLYEGVYIGEYEIEGQKVQVLKESFTVDALLNGASSDEGKAFIDNYLTAREIWQIMWTFKEESVPQVKVTERLLRYAFQHECFIEWLVSKKIIQIEPAKEAMLFSVGQKFKFHEESDTYFLCVASKKEVHLLNMSGRSRWNNTVVPKDDRKITYKEMCEITGSRRPEELIEVTE